MTATQMTTMTLKRAREIAADRATVNEEDGFLRITGTFFHDAVPIAREIAIEAHPQTSALPGFWPERHVIARAGYVAAHRSQILTTAQESTP